MQPDYTDSQKICLKTQCIRLADKNAFFSAFFRLWVAWATWDDVLNLNYLFVAFFHAGIMSGLVV